jgi:hypothetical protein
VAGTGSRQRARWWRRHGGAEEEDREVLMGPELSSLMAAGSTLDERGGWSGEVPVSTSVCFDRHYA